MIPWLQSGRATVGRRGPPPRSSSGLAQAQTVRSTIARDQVPSRVMDRNRESDQHRESHVGSVDEPRREQSDHHDDKQDRRPDENGRSMTWPGHRPSTGPPIAITLPANSDLFCDLIEVEVETSIERTDRTETLIESPASLNREQDGENTAQQREDHRVRKQICRIPPRMCKSEDETTSDACQNTDPERRPRIVLAEVPNQHPLHPKEPGAAAAESNDAGLLRVCS